MSLELLSRIKHLQNNKNNIRNICIVAHVDHGKTTLADALVASNGIISNRLSGKLRYMDSRDDEQERGITMKSSAVSLAFDEYLINLIDTPGHVDFFGEVSTALRLCDGAIIVVDVIEGVQPQTKVVLSQTYQEGIKTVLVLNKIDRLITEKKLNTIDAYLHLRSVLEQVNAVIGELFATDVMEKNVETTKTDSGLEDADDSELYFSPEKGNVIFASAYDSWSFSIQQFARIYSKKLEFNENSLRQTMWGDYYINTKTKRIIKGAQSKGKKPLFVQLILENIWNIYEAANKTNENLNLEDMIKKLQIKVLARDLRSTDSSQRVRGILSQWLPLAACLLTMVVKKLPSPNELSENRIRKLMCSKMKRFDALPSETQQLEKAFMECSSSEDAPTIVFVSKMLPIQKDQLLKNKPKKSTLSYEEMAEIREKYRQSQLKSDTQNKEDKDKNEEYQEEPVQYEKKDTIFVGFARIFSGTLKKGKSIYVLGPKYDPRTSIERIHQGQEICDGSENIRNNKSKYHIMKTTVSELYLFLGRDLEEIETISAGNVFGVGGLNDYIINSATLSDEYVCPPFVEMSQQVSPILRVAIEPKLSSDLDKLEYGLMILNQADVNVEIELTDQGEFILITVGEVHLEKCLKDLKETYAGVDIVVSSPIVPFRETIIKPPEIDMVNEKFGDDNKIKNKSDENEKSKIIQINTPNQKCTLQIRAYPLTKEIIKLLETNSDIFKSIQSINGLVSMSDKTRETLSIVRKELEEQFKKIEDIQLNSNQVWSLGPQKNCTNILFNHVSSFQHTSIWEVDILKSVSNNDKHILSEFEASIINGFQLTSQFGPLCEEPLMGVAFILEDFKYNNITESDSNDTHGPLSGQIVSTMKDGCRKAFQLHPQRLMAAMYHCDIQVKSEALGKLYASLGKRNGRVVCEDMIEGSSTFNVTAYLPVIESYQFSQEIRRQTSGLAMPQLIFSHWDIVDVDPFWVPQTEQELLLLGDKSDSDNQALKYMNDVRKRKGLKIDEKLVEFAEKQRTLTKMK